jgi:hypothetical protein
MQHVFHRFEEKSFVFSMRSLRVGTSIAYQSSAYEQHYDVDELIDARHYIGRAWYVQITLQQRYIKRIAQGNSLYYHGEQRGFRMAERQREGDRNHHGNRRMSNKEFRRKKYAALALALSCDGDLFRSFPCSFLFRYSKINRFFLCEIGSSMRERLFFDQEISDRSRVQCIAGSGLAHVER